MASAPSAVPNSRWSPAGSRVRSRWTEKLKLPAVHRGNSASSDAGEKGWLSYHPRISCAMFGLSRQSFKTRPMERGSRKNEARGSVVSVQATASGMCRGRNAQTSTAVASTRAIASQRMRRANALIIGSPTPRFETTRPDPPKPGPAGDDRRSPGGRTLRSVDRRFYSDPTRARSSELKTLLA